MSMKAIILYFLAPLIIFLIFLNYYSRIVPKIPLQHYDEYEWIARSYFFDLFIKGDFANPLWSDYRGYEQAKLGEYYYGLLLYPTYLKEKERKGNSTYRYWQFLADHYFFSLSGKEYEDYKIRIPNFINWRYYDSDIVLLLTDKYGSNFSKISDLIFKARRVNVWVTALTVIVVYFIGLKVSGPLIAVLGSLLYGFNKLIIESSLIAHSEVLFLLFLNIGVYLLLLIFDKKRENNKVNLLFDKRIMLFSLIVTLCSATKLNGFMLLIFFLFLSLFPQIIKNTKKVILNITIVITLTFSFFLILNPFLYSDPLRNFGLMLNLRLKIVQGQTREYTDTFLPSFKSRLVKIYTRFLDPTRTENFNTPYFLRKDSIFYNSFSSFFFVLGVFSALLKFAKEKNNHRPIKIVTIIFFLTQFIMGWYLVLDWSRYYVQLVIFFVLFEALGIKLFTGLLCDFIKKILIYRRH